MYVDNKGKWYRIRWTYFTYLPAKDQTQCNFLSKWRIIGKVMHLKFLLFILIRKICPRNNFYKFYQHSKFSFKTWIWRVASSIPSQGTWWVAGQVPSGGHMRGNHTLMFLSLSFSLPSPLSKNKYNLLQIFS